MNLKEAIKHTKEVISKLDNNCKCKEEHKQLLYFLEELEIFRDAEFNNEIDIEVIERVERHRLYIQCGIREKREKVCKYDFSKL